ncbi:MAG: hypothetical protein ACOC1K_02340 [Nanoarchaeota archaeon]
MVDPKKIELIEKLYSVPKSKKFVNHLIQAYMPVHKIQKVWEFTDEKKKHSCCICNIELFDIEEAFRNIQENRDNMMSETMEHLKKQLNGENTDIKDHPMYKYVSKGRVQALSGEKTNTFMCNGCAEALIQFVTHGILSGDKNMIWLTNKMKRKQIFNSFDDSSFLNRVEKENVKQIEKKVEKKKATFGDIEALQKLKEKMEKGEE